MSPMLLVLHLLASIRRTLWLERLAQDAGERGYAQSEHVFKRVEVDGLHGAADARRGGLYAGVVRKQRVDNSVDDSSQAAPVGVRLCGGEPHVEHPYEWRGLMENVDAVQCGVKPFGHQSVQVARFWLKVRGRHCAHREGSYAARSVLDQCDGAVAFAVCRALPLRVCKGVCNQLVHARVAQQQHSFKVWSAESQARQAVRLACGEHLGKQLGDGHRIQARGKRAHEALALCHQPDRLEWTVVQQRKHDTRHAHGPHRVQHGVGLEVFEQLLD
mmetsp:Transcript_12062/g.32471  ORF Transcript_12062/g.32471 Transcript_12062/m.32471 type:complete len:273 (-) Transcript_12062:29-847(-)